MENIRGFLAVSLLKLVHLLVSAVDAIEVASPSARAEASELMRDVRAHMREEEALHRRILEELLTLSVLVREDGR